MAHINNTWWEELDSWCCCEIIRLVFENFWPRAIAQHVSFWKFHLQKAIHLRKSRIIKLISYVTKQIAATRGSQLEHSKWLHPGQHSRCDKRESFQTQVKLFLFFQTLIKILTNGGEKLQVYFDLVINSGISPDVSYHINLRFIFYSQP